MTNNRDEQNIQDIQDSKSKSLIITFFNRLAAFIYSLFTDTWIGRTVMADRNSYDESAVGRFLSGEYKSNSAREKRRTLSGALERGAAAKIFRKISATLSAMSVNVYGLFFAVYGSVAMLIYFVAVYILPATYYVSESNVLTCAFIIICSIPFLSSAKSVCEIFGSGRIAKKIATSYFCIPEEKLLSKRRCGGTIYMLISATLGILLGSLSLFISPIAVVLGFVVINMLFLIFAIPEVGLLISVTALPFMQYISFTEVMLIALVSFTGIAYVLKVIRGNRTFYISSAGVMVILYCVAMIVASSFSSLGSRAALNGLSVAVVVAGGYFLGANLTRKPTVRKVCIKVLTVSLVILAVLQFWNVYYLSISSGLEYSLNFNYSSIIDKAGLNVTYNVRLPGLLAAMLSPLLIAECFRQKRIYNIVTIILCFIPVILSIALYGTFEIMVALILGIALYLIMFSHKTLTAIILISIPAVTVFLLLPDVLSLAGINVPTWIQFVNFIFPDNSELSSVRSSVVADVWKMIGDGVNFMGIGVGDDVFAYNFASYASLTSEGSRDAGTMYMQIICESGILGFSIFAIFACIIVKHSLRFVIKQTDRGERVTTLALLCGFITAVILGAICCIYSDIQMRFLFWICAGMLSGQINKNKYDQRRLQSTMSSSADMTDVSIKI